MVMQHVAKLLLAQKKKLYHSVHKVYLWLQTLFASLHSYFEGVSLDK